MRLCSRVRANAVRDGFYTLKTDRETAHTYEERGFKMARREEISPVHLASYFFGLWYLYIYYNVCVYVCVKRFRLLVWHK